MEVQENVLPQSLVERLLVVGLEQIRTKLGLSMSMRFRTIRTV
jgi:hypothetical protein